jgi:hybrid cluster-associated redox disulfide protein
MTQETGVQEAITAEMRIGDVVKKYPQTVRVFLSHGLMCVGCAVARFENIRQGAEAHGINVDALVKDLNKAVQQSD